MAEYSTRPDFDAARDVTATVYARAPRARVAGRTLHGALRRGDRHRHDLGGRVPVRSRERPDRGDAHRRKSAGDLRRGRDLADDPHPAGHRRARGNAPRAGRRAQPPDRRSGGRGGGGRATTSSTRWWSAIRRCSTSCSASIRSRSAAGRICRCGRTAWKSTPPSSRSTCCRGRRCSCFRRSPATSAATRSAALLTRGPEFYRGTQLLIDIGTNGEVVLAHNGELIATSCATGPVYEGAHIRCGMRAVPGAIERVWVDARRQDSLRGDQGRRRQGRSAPGRACAARA